MKKKVLFIFIILLVIVLVAILIKKNQDEQYWLNYSPLSVKIENRISGEVKSLKSPSEIEKLLTEIKSIRYTSNKAEETWGLGYSIFIEYEDLIVNYYFATSTHLFIVVNDENWREYIIEPKENSIYLQLKDSFKNTNNN
ncbi:hypothetical protein QE109_02295 [Fusibacter bizertensis]|uniref:Bacterial Pleckstrin homology domain-containing protein n=1 Tax=Fusibacter bizertensis TaxID=1488331 RepID=A0ABT6N959_9FIRM|nr:hypothetical protein [Fusibacter bizertensis]MDH8676957.1 hypothetical protein [Fusibacter bizertensis]